MSSDRAGLLKSRAESFARHLQTRLKTLSESQDDAWSEGGGDAEVYYDIGSPLASPEEEAAEPVFIAAQNRNSLPLQRTDSEASTYYDTLESVEELQAMSPTKLFNGGGNGLVPSVGQGLVHFLDNNTKIDSFDISSILKLKNENIISNINSFSDAGTSGTFDSLRIKLEVSEQKTDNVCDMNGQEENNNVGKDLEQVTDLIFALELSDCDETKVKVDTRQTEGEGTPTGEGCRDLESQDDEYCVFCDLEQIKTSLANDGTEVCKTNSSPSVCVESNISTQINEDMLEEDMFIPRTETREDDNNTTRSEHKDDLDINDREIPQIIVENHTNNGFVSSENSSISNIFQELKTEITNESNKDEGNIEILLSMSTKGSSEVVEAKCEVDEFDIDTRRRHFQRSSSLKTGKTPPGTPGRKKIVRFADVLGLDLADVKTFLDEVPTVPKSAYEDLHYLDSAGEQVTESLSSNAITVVVPQVEKVLTPLFQQPCVRPDFLDRVRQHNVSLENAIVSDMSLFAISGLVRVKNMDFHKSVHVRYTINNWRSFSDLQARYIPHSCDGFSDKFSFTLYAHTLGVGQRLEFAVRFQAAGAQFWDNNAGLNYVFVCNSLLQTSNSPSLPVSADDVTAAFY